MNVAEALYTGIVDNPAYTLGNEQHAPADIVAALRPLYPSESAAARELGIPRSTWRRWARGARPTAAGFAALQAAQRRARLPREREAWMRSGHIVLIARIRFSDQVEIFPRLISGWPSVPGAPANAQPDGMQSRILNAWLRADDVSAVDTIMEVVVAGTSVDNAQLVDVISIQWYPTRGAAQLGMRNARVRVGR